MQVVISGMGCKFDFEKEMQVLISGRRCQFDFGKEMPRKFVTLLTEHRNDGEEEYRGTPPSAPTSKFHNSTSSSCSIHSRLFSFSVPFLSHTVSPKNTHWRLH
ncbi:hypothetical protein L6452_37303 [Arctium lappa]|uniref:Uncharacterized protein n=1 Tax=Arctium lappa TaxID=4217 RepID=A0ACB8Y2K4_ARCLA|nr:hypothetical protein L6452_37303 [Arctium lappa]